jgi:hypothetical protein
MNRRGLLRFFGLAPVALPIAVKTAVASIEKPPPEKTVDAFREGFMSIEDAYAEQGLDYEAVWNSRIPIPFPGEKILCPTCPDCGEPIDIVDGCACTGFPLGAVT